MNNDMSNKMRKRKYIKLLFLVIWMIIIFYFSHQDGNTSKNLSDGLLTSTYKLFNNESLMIKDIILKYGALFRKIAHLLEYFILGILLHLNVKEYINKNTIIISMICGLLYAISDEIHQLFVMGRSFGIKDIMIDFIGCLIGILCIIKRKE